VQVLNKQYGQVQWSNGFEPLLKVVKVILITFYLSIYSR
jgi:hypothetical protein